jgi:WhiB family redox-sensing transcriptional regulator
MGYPVQLHVTPTSIREFLDLTAKAAEGGTACRKDPDLFWSLNEADMAAAKKLCRTSGPNGGPCPLLTGCRKFAISDNQNEGVWGGLTPDERRKVKRAERAERRRDARIMKKIQETLHAGQEMFPIFEERTN